jgi:hypothetical protein
MPAIPSNSVDLVTAGISFLLTLMILSYLIGDNPLFRLAVYIFVGVAAGYSAAVTWHQVLYPRLFVSLRSGNLLTIIPLVMGLLLLLKISPRTSRLGTPSTAFMVGIGAAVAIGGAVMGTLFPQTWSSIKVFNLSTVGQAWLETLVSAIFMLIGTVASLVYFHYGAKATANGAQRGILVRALSWLGQIFIAITFGVVFAGVLMAAVTALIKSLSYLAIF